MILYDAAWCDAKRRRRIVGRAMEMRPSVFSCDECRRLVRALRTAWRDDSRALRTRFSQTAGAAGRDVRQFTVGWIFSVATMPDDEMKALLDTHYPKVADANRKREAHETESGHSLNGWWVLSQYMPDEE